MRITKEQREIKRLKSAIKELTYMLYTYRSYPSFKPILKKIKRIGWGV